MSTVLPVEGLFVGLATLDIIYRVSDFPRADEKIRALSQEMAAGGPAANAAVTFAELGGNATLFTSLGCHPLALQARNDLKTHGVEVIDSTPNLDEPPTVATILVKDSTGERTVISRGAYHQDIRFRWDPTLQTVVDRAEVVLLDGHHPALALAMARRARDRPIVIDAGSWKPVLDELIPLATHCFASAKFRTPTQTSHQDPVAAVLDDLRTRLRNSTLRHVVGLTRGPEDVCFSTTGTGDERHSSDRIDTVSVPSITAVDTLGAGDVFHGALAFSLPRQAPDPARQIFFANCVAALRCAHKGPRSYFADPRFERLCHCFSVPPTNEDEPSRRLGRVVDWSCLPWPLPDGLQTTSQLD